jgi:hypothetical protein
MTINNYRFDCSYKSPDNLHLIVDSVHELVILQYLIQLSDGLEVVHPSQLTLTLGLMCVPTADNAIDGLVAKGYIVRIKREFPLSNEYKICADVINSQIDIKSKGKHRRSEKERMAMAKHYTNMYPDVSREVLVNNFNDRVIEKTGVIHDKGGR